MSIYDQRNKPAYRESHVNIKYAKNKHILRWWTSDHDKLLQKQISKWHWLWSCEIIDAIIQKTPEDVIDAWQENDPACSKHAWYNVLTYFAEARVKSKRWARNTRKPKWNVCPLCNQKFIESSLPFPLAKRLGIDHLNFCAPCLKDIVFQHNGNPNLSKSGIKLYLQELTDALQRVPPQGFGEGLSDFHSMDDDQRLSIMKILQKKPTTERVKEIFGSWLNALIQAEILEDGTRKTSRGIQSIAKDGLVCLSLGEKTIDDYLFGRGISHIREPHYPEGKFRADFLVGDVFIEYFGLKGNPEYDAKTKLKQRLCKKHEIRLISIYPTDIINTKKLEKKLSPITSSDG